MCIANRIDAIRAIYGRALFTLFNSNLLIISRVNKTCALDLHVNWQHYSIRKAVLSND